jgi:hypothetical protein
MGIADGKDGSPLPTPSCRPIPVDELEVNLPALMGLMQQASSIADLVSFFSESPLDGLRGDGAVEPRLPPDPAATPARAPQPEP